MKKLLVMVILLVSFTTVALAEDYSVYTREELLALRTKLFEELTIVNTAYGATFINTESTGEDVSDSLGTIISLFPDEQFALYIRDNLAKFSINQTVTQAELDTIFTVSFRDSIYKPSDITGIHYLRNLTFLDLSTSNVSVIPDEICELKYLSNLQLVGVNVSALPDTIGKCTELSYIFLSGSSILSLPDSITNLVNLRTLIMDHTKVKVLPDEIGNLINLQHLEISYTEISSLPDTIGNLTNLQYLSISHTEISSLPDTIGNLMNLQTFDMSYTKIRTLPESIYGLKVLFLDMSGTQIK